MWGKKIAQIES